MNYRSFAARRKFACQISLCGTEPSSDTRNLSDIRIENYRYLKSHAAQKSALKPQSDERAGEIHGYTVAEQRYPWAAAPQADLHLFGLIAKIITLT